MIRAFEALGDDCMKASCARWLARLALWMAALLAGVAATAQPVLRIATEGTYPPWSYKDAQGRLQGWDVDIANALCEKMKVRCEIVAQDWDGIIPGLLAHKYDEIVASMAVTEQRRQRVDFTNKYKSTVSRFVARKGTPPDVSADALRGKAIGVQRGSIQAGYLAAHYKGSDIKLYDTPQAAELDLLAGRVDYIFGNMVTYHVGFLKQAEARDFDFVGPELKGGLLGEGNAIAVRKNSPQLLQQLNGALAAIIADGTYERITATYFPFKLM
jgi:arginine/ornithine transport system substrate-binding protein